MNNVMLVGRLTKEPEIVEGETGKKRTFMTLAVNRSYKNAEGIYETDFIPCLVWDGLAENLTQYCTKGDVVGVRGRIQQDTIEKEDGTKENKLIIVVEKLTFLSSKKSEDSEETTTE